MQVMAEFDPKWIGECCRQAGISEDDITTHALAEKLTQPLSKGVIYELNRFRKNNGYTSVSYTHLTLPTNREV